MFGLICSPIAKLSKDPSYNSERTDEVLYGTYVEIIKEEKPFYLVHTMYNYTGYINQNDVWVIKTPVNHLKDLNSIITRHFADVQIAPDDRSDKIISLPCGAYLNVISEQKNQYHLVELVNKQKGYIKKHTYKYRRFYHKQKEETTIRKNLVNNALSYLNTQYRWGGKTPEGIDCSGLCQMAYMLEEIIIYRDSTLNDDITAQYNLRQIELKDLKLGDLIYTKNHVMMYIGNDRYIHASSNLGGVTISSLNDTSPNYYETLANAIICCKTVF